MAAQVDATLECRGGRPYATLFGEAGEVAGDRDDGGRIAAPSRISHHMIAMRSAYFERLVIAYREDIGEFGP